MPAGTMDFKTVNAELKRRSNPHRVAKVMTHDPLCLVSDGTILPVYPCTCKLARFEGKYVLVLGN